jgi:predicted HicB family RNase H-like nuclease
MKEAKNQKLKKMLINSERVTVNVKLLPKMHKALRAQALRDNTSMQEIIVGLIDKYLKNN